MTDPAYLPFLFIALALVFFAVAFRDYRRTEGKPSLARKTWLRTGLIFCAVGIGLLALKLFAK